MSKQGATPNKPSNSMETLARIFVGILVITLIGLFVYLLNPFGNKPSAPPVDDNVKPKQIVNDSEPTDYQFYELLPDQQVTGASPKPVTTNSSQKPDAVVVQKKPAKAEPQDKSPNTPENPDTQNIQPTIEVVNNNHIQNSQSQLEAQTSKPKAIIENADNGKTYILQINSFDNAEEADRRRAEVLMAGVDAQIVKRRLDDDTMIYQVISRQMPNSQMAQQAQKRLQNSGIDSLIVEQRHR